MLESKSSVAGVWSERGKMGLRGPRGQTMLSLAATVRSFNL